MSSLKMETSENHSNTAHQDDDPTLPSPDVVDANNNHEMPQPLQSNGEDKDNTTMMKKSSDEDEALLGKAISSLLATVTRDFDSKAQDTLRSQDDLSFALQRLTRELDQLLEDAPLPFIMQHAAKISGVRKRVSSLNSVLKSIQRRVDNMDRMLSIGTEHEKTTAESSRQH